MGLFDKFKSPKKPLKGDKKKKKVVKAGKKPAKNPKSKKGKKGKLTIDDLNVNPVLEDNLYKIMDTAMDDPDEPYVAKADMEGNYYVYGLALNDKLIKENGFDQGQPTILSQIKTGLDIGGKHGADADGALVNASFDQDLHSNANHQIVFVPTVKTLQNLENIGGSDAKYQVTIIPADISSENFDEYFSQGLINANLSNDDGTPMELTIDGFKDLTESLDNDPAFKKDEGVEDDLGDNDLDNDDDLGDFSPDTSMPDDSFDPDNEFDPDTSSDPDDDFGDNSLPGDDFGDTSLTNPDDDFGDNSLPGDDFDDTSLTNPDDNSSSPDDDLPMANPNDNSSSPDDDLPMANPNDNSSSPDDDLPMTNPDDDLPLVNSGDDFNTTSSTSDNSSADTSSNDKDDDIDSLLDDGDDLSAFNADPDELDENSNDDDDAPIFENDNPDTSSNTESENKPKDEESDMPSSDTDIDKLFDDNDDLGLNDSDDEPENDGDSDDEPENDGDSDDEPVEPEDDGDSDNEPEDDGDSDDEPEDDGDSDDEPEDEPEDDGDSDDEPEDDGDSDDEPEDDGDSDVEPEDDGDSDVEPEKPKTLGEQNLNNFIARNIIKLDAALDSLDTERFRVDTNADSSSTVGYKSLYNDLLSSQIKREKEYIRSRYKQEIGQLLDPYVNPASFAGHFVKVNQLLEDKFMSPDEMAKQTEETKASISARYDEIHQDLLEKARAKAEMEFTNRYEPECQRELAEAEKAVTVKHQQEYDEAVQKVLNKLFFDNQTSLTAQSQKIITRLIDEDIPNANLALTSQAKAYSEEMVRYEQFEKMIDARTGVSREKLDQGTAKALERMQKEIDENKKAQKAKDKQIANLETQLNESKAVKKTEPAKTTEENQNQKDLEVLKHASVEVKQDDVLKDLINRFAKPDEPDKAEPKKQAEDEKTPEK